MKAWFLYIVECSDGSYYTGITTDIDRRILEHNYSDSSGSKYTRSRRPVKLVYKKPCKDRSAASKEEYAIKRKSRKEKIKLISESQEVNHDI
jgi:putative endonuclease